MILRTGDMWKVYNQADLFLITTNSTIKNNGRLVMGRGIARQARDKFPGLDLALGRKIPHLGIYGLLISENFPTAKLGAFQVKTRYDQKAELSIIAESTAQLKRWASEHKDLQIHLNFPGIGNGKLDPLDVLCYINPLPNNVTVWSLDNVIDWNQYQIEHSDDPNEMFFMFGN